MRRRTLERHERVLTGPQEVAIDGDAEVRIVVEVPGTIFWKGEYMGPTDRDGVFRGRTRGGGTLAVELPEGAHWALEVVAIPPDIEYPDPVPVEVDANLFPHETLLEKLQRFIREQVAHEYGRESAEFETFEDSVDFGDDEDEVLLSGFEVPDTVPEEPAPEPARPVPTPEPEPPAPEPAAPAE